MQYFNSTNGPLVYTDDGIIVGGGEWVTAEPTEKINKLVAEGVLIDVTAPEIKPEPTETTVEEVRKTTARRKTAGQENTESESE